MLKEDTKHDRIKKTSPPLTSRHSFSQDKVERVYDGRRTELSDRESVPGRRILVLRGLFSFLITPVLIVFWVKVDE